MIEAFKGVKKSMLFTRNKFDAKKTANLILKRLNELHGGQSFVTLRDTKELWYYNNGIFNKYGETIIEETLENLLNGIKTGQIMEVLGHIKRTTYIDRAQLGNEPHLIACDNGVLDLRTCKLYSHSPNFLMTVKIPVKYDPQADCPNIKQFLSDVVEPEYVPVLEELTGYCLYRDYPIQKAAMLLGEGNNGKSTFLNVQTALLGKRNVSNVPLQDFSTDRFASSDLYLKLANIVADLDSRELKRTGLFKALTGGDYVRAQEKFKNPFNFVNYAKLIYSCNRLPKSSDNTHAYFRRWLPIPFNNRFEGKACDPNILKKLTTPEELSGFLNLAIAGLQRLLNNGRFSTTSTTEEIREYYIRKSDPVAAFVNEAVEQDYNSCVPKKELYNAFLDYCDIYELIPIPYNVFNKQLKNLVDLEYYRKREGQIRFGAWRGIKLNW